MSLQNLNQLAIEAQASCNKYHKEEIILSDKFKNEFYTAFSKQPSEKITFAQFTSIIETSSGLSITFPNQWFYIASYFIEYLTALKEYKQAFSYIFQGDPSTRELIKELKEGGDLPTSLADKINSHFESEHDRDFFKTFLTDYTWWFGSKTIDRGDYYVSPVLNLANVVNLSQSYIADLAYFISDNPSLKASLLLSQVVAFDNTAKIYSDSNQVLFSSDITKDFIFKVFKFLKLSDRLQDIMPFVKINQDPKFHSIEYKTNKLTSIFWVFDHIANEEELSQGGALRAFKDSIFTHGNNNYYLSGEWTDTTSNHRLNFQSFKIIFNEIYSGLYMVEFKDGIYYLFTLIKHPLNQILYGPPGSGKTYNAINHALAIIKGINVSLLIKEQNSNPSIRKKHKKEFDNYLSEGRIQFVTFHQSYSYEEFVEGIKPVINNNGDLEYVIQDGSFKKICAEAIKKSSFSVKFDEAKKQLTKPLFEELYYQFSDTLPEHTLTDSSVKLKTKEGKEFQLFKNSNRSIVVKAGIKQTPSSVALNELSQVLFDKKTPTYKSYEPIILDKIFEDKEFEQEEINNTQKPFVLIIDEINRGNISRIFGELITLIEDTKRIGQPEQLLINLAYSGTNENPVPFGVPSNLYIIGTMNTADRSIALVDLALRRRFTFIEYTANHDLLKVTNDDIDLNKMLKTMNKRIEFLLDKDHLLGHAYFLNVKNKNELSAVFLNKIIPLLQEYFYNDYKKSSWVLGDHKDWKKNKDLYLINNISDFKSKDLFGFNPEDEFDGKADEIYELNNNLLNGQFDNIPKGAFISIYDKNYEENPGIIKGIS